MKAIATAHHEATAAGERMFARGGSAVDAAIAAAAVLAVVYPHNTSIGGDMVALVSQGAGDPELVTAFGWAPAAVDASAWGTSGRVDARGPRSITVPGALKGWDHLHRRYGRLPWADLFGPAIELAAGYEIASSVRHAITDTVADHPEAAEFMASLFGPEWEEAASASNPALGRSLTRIAEAGAEDFYTGDLAEAVLDYLRTIRPDFAAADFAEYAVTSEPSLSAAFAGHEVHTSGVPSQGFALLRFLADLSGHLGGNEDPALMSDALLSRLWLDSFTQSDHLRDSVLADGCDARKLLDEEAGAAEAADPMPKGSGDTIGIAADDGELSVSLIQSLYSWFGSLCLDETNGIVFQSRGSMFSLDPDSPQLVRGRTRPPHTLMPVLVTDPGGSVEIVLATMGGKAQAQIHARLLVGLLRGLTPAEALALPRWVSGPSEPGDPERFVSVESDVPADLVETLAAEADAPPRVTAPLSNEMGHANIVDLRGPVPVAAADPRSDGSAWVG